MLWSEIIKVKRKDVGVKFWGVILNRVIKLNRRYTNLTNTEHPIYYRQNLKLQHGGNILRWKKTLLITTLYNQQTIKKMPQIVHYITNWWQTDSIGSKPATKMLGSWHDQQWTEYQPNNAPITLYCHVKNMFTKPRCFSPLVRPKDLGTKIEAERLLKFTILKLFH